MEEASWSKYGALKHGAESLQCVRLKGIYACPLKRFLFSLEQISKISGFAIPPISPFGRSKNAIQTSLLAGVELVSVVGQISI